MEYLRRFLKESLQIEGIERDPSPEEVDATEEFLEHRLLTPLKLEDLVAVYQPGAVLRRRVGLNVRVGRHLPPPGGPAIEESLDELLLNIRQGHLTPWQAHVAYETLHPFTDGNGRSGRTLWLWHVTKVRAFRGLTFLHHFYYQTLQETRL